MADLLGGATMRQVVGAGGVRLAAVEEGNPDGPPILFIHGFSQAALCWTRQFTGELARDFRLIGFDLRGHGHSDKPEDPAAYQSPELWADDVAAVIAAFGLERPVLAGWSFGGRVLGAVARRHGTAGLGGLAFVGAISKGGVPDAQRFRGITGPFQAAMGSADMAEAAAGTLRFIQACTAAPLPPDLQRLMDLTNGMTPPWVRRAMMGWQVDHDDLLPTLRVPALVIHGAQDQVLLPSAGHHIAALLPGAELRIYEASGHAPFLEEPARFDADLADFARRVRAG
ncbi:MULTISPECIES: alpha/beta fold hydrolase [Roseomonadaceae]|uniref:Alpha/beta hydrolase n=1 Tax=Falsiroseomonas oleicola TaxID=2801474 RepID=A0ABS6H532_9PROT|nr:alpha/beta hydrolase [Roseomonas oleicola]MBU8543795.1 alpha/beta hydrolase [Roseomonas oleicola]